MRVLPRTSHIATIAAWSLGALISVFSPAHSGLLRPMSCRMDECFESEFIGKTPIKPGNGEVLYEVRQRFRSWSTKNYNAPRPSLASVPFGPATISFVLCSTRRPAFIFKPSDSPNFIAHRLNPGGDYYGYNRSSYENYWLICHNLVGPDYFTPEMTSRAIALGYPGNLPSDQVNLDHPLDAMR